MAEERCSDLDPQLLLAAASQHKVDELRLFLKTGSANFKDPETGYSPLHAAVAFTASKSKPAGAGAETLIGTRETPGSVNDSPNEANGEATDGDLDSSQVRGTERTADASNAAEETIGLLLQNGAIWNDLDKNGETPGCIAYRLGKIRIYDMMVDAGFRAEILLHRLDEYEELDGQESAEAEEDPEQSQDVLQPDSSPDREDETVAKANGDHDGGDEASKEEAETPRPSQQAEDSLHGHASGSEVHDTPNNDEYLQSALTFTDDRILDQERNGVMMSWEDDIMRRTVELLCSNDADNVADSGASRARKRGLRILNVGHGMGIIDNYFQKQKPSSHHIVEAHPSVLAKMRDEGWMGSTSTSPPSPSDDKTHLTSGGGTAPPTATSTIDQHAEKKRKKPGVVVHEGRWQDVLPTLVAEDASFDVIYFDTFAEDYAAFKEFFREQVIGLLDADGGKWSFFNGMGADRRVCYDVYSKVVEFDLLEAGFDVDWLDVPVPEAVLSRGDSDADRLTEQERTWQGVKRRYWNVDSYRLPVCRFIG